MWKKLLAKEEGRGGMLLGFLGLSETVTESEFGKDVETGEEEIE